MKNFKRILIIVSLVAAFCCSALAFSSCSAISKVKSFYSQFYKSDSICVDYTITDSVGGKTKTARISYDENKAYFNFDGNEVFAEHADDGIMYSYICIGGQWKRTQEKIGNLDSMVQESFTGDDDSLSEQIKAQMSELFDANNYEEINDSIISKEDLSINFLKLKLQKVNISIGKKTCSVKAEATFAEQSVVVDIVVSEMNNVLIKLPTVAK